ncbi:MAG: DUF2085 domain-containing protein, partial [Anaerolineaceae bacterium]|nr:DUF2085 domain-containing protein [Anaerolineaceae bacterium]
LSTGKRAAGLPPLKFTLIFAGFLVVFGIDGINSSLHLFPGFRGIYEPHNWLRLVTGSAVGVALPVYLLPVFHLTAWEKFENRPMLSTWKEFGTLILLATALDISVLSENPLLLYPIALLGAGGVLALFTVIFTSLWLMLLQKEQLYHSWRGLLFPLLGGLATTFVLVLGMDIARLALTHTWEGFPLPW